MKQELQIHIDSERSRVTPKLHKSTSIMHDAKKFDVFVTDTVQLIRDHIDVEQWQYVSTKENPLLTWILLKGTSFN